MSDESAPLIPTSTSTSRRAKNMYWTLGCIYGATAVGFGAFGAHGLKKVVTDPAKLASFATAAHYQLTYSSKLIHSVALLVATRAAPENKLAAGLFTAGMTMFSGSIYALVLDPARFRFMGPITPLGGLCLIGGWAALAF
ncbi:hypothetical protein FHL15_002720 [Xylaria flabelliformis]|uniref:DUF423 domain-containing protein n=1 Tax=Xylaria flabelliformis TaxID=2512241 RepID=A0A553I8C1_9PEZI|nr:hypothetical protein FHL15_002720 [Xylaria flabelliformis]